MTQGSNPHDGAAAPAVEGCLDACRRCRRLVDAVGEDYALIGPHLRHCVDHFRSLLTGLSRGVVDYDARARVRRLETDAPTMLGALTEIVAQLVALDRGCLGRPIEVRQIAAPGTDPLKVTSNVERELVFLSGHTIHHIAIAARILETRGGRLEEPLDVAFSTDVMLQSQGAGDGHA